MDTPIPGSMAQAFALRAQALSKEVEELRRSLDPEAAARLKELQPILNYLEQLAQNNGEA